MAGCSGRPLFAKLGLTPGMAAVLVNPPDHYSRLLWPDAPDIAIQHDVAPGSRFVHVFTKTQSELATILTATLPLIARDGMIWVSWPKKASKVPTDLTEDLVRDIALPLGLVDVKVCAVDAVWSALKLVIRKELR